MIVFRLGL